MENFNSEIIFSTSDQATSRLIHEKLKTGALRQLHPRVFTSNLSDDPAKIVARHLYPILGKLYRGAILSHRTALDGRPSPDGTIFLSYRYTKKMLLPGFTIRLLKGFEPLEDDMPFVGGLFMSSIPRAYLENCMPSRNGSTDAKCISLKDIEERLDRLIQTRGETELNRLRDRARAIAPQLNMESAFSRLDKTISTILGTRPNNAAVSDAGKARSQGMPYDQNRLPLFEALFSELRRTTFPLFKPFSTDISSLRNVAFFESYFSNFIEGTEFELQVARDIVFNNIIPEGRPNDAHDILGTFRIVSNREEMLKTPVSTDNFFHLLTSRHALLMESRAEVLPGIFKIEVNRAGQTTFVAPELVRGTLQKGIEMIAALEQGTARAIFVMFLISEVHPFTDGNGRIARIMMNAELVSAGCARILIPIVFRNDYLQALRALSRTANPAPLVRVLLFAQQFTSQINFSDFDAAHAILQRCNALSDETDARLLLPKTDSNKSTLS